MAGPLDYFKMLPGPRVERTQLHDFHEVIAIVLVAAICGRDDWTAVETFGNARKAFPKTFPKLENGIPSH